MEALNQGRKLYMKCYDHETSLLEEDKKQLKLKNDIQRFINISIKEALLQQLYAHTFVMTILQAALEKCDDNNVDIGPVARAFGSVESYILLLVEQPWKPEYRKIKVYGGFFRTRIQSVLLRAEEIFTAAGYTVTPDRQFLIHKGPIDKHQLLTLAFDCHIASEQSKNIADQYKKQKGIGYTYMNVLSQVFPQVGRFKEKTLLSNTSFIDKRTRNIEMLKNQTLSKLVPTGPPLPKREPIVNGLASQSNRPPELSFESAYGTWFEQGLDGQDINFRSPRVLLSPRIKPPSQPSRFDYGSDSVKSPLLTKTNSPKPFPYMDTTTEEIIPELPQGTCDDHMRESIKLVNLQGDAESMPALQSFSGAVTQEFNSDDCKWFRKLQDTDGIIDPSLNTNHSGWMPHSVTGSVGTASVPLSVQTYPPGITKSKWGSRLPNNDPSIDEGIQMDMSLQYLQSRGLGSISQQPQQVLLPNKLSSEFYLVSDQGHRMQGVYQPPKSVITTASRTIYRPPPVDGSAAVICGNDVSINHGKQVVSTSTIPPPPVPSRAQKPGINVRAMRTNDMMDNGRPPPYAYNQTAHSEQKMIPFVISPVSNHSNFILSAGQTSVPTTSDMSLSQPSDTELILIRDKMAHLGKSKSLKCGDERTRAANIVAQSRAARSMDLTSSNQWRCGVCNSNNADRDVCGVCSHSQYGPSVVGPVCNQTKKACTSCTYENEPTQTHCEICAGKLDDMFTHV